MATQEPAVRSFRFRTRGLVGAGAVALVLALSAGVAEAVPGSLTFIEQDKGGVGGVDGLGGATGLATAPDGTQVYVTAFLDDAVTTFSRDAGSGALTFVEQDRDGVDGVDGLDFATNVVASPDGAHLYAAGPGDDAVVTLSRDPATGALTFIELERDGVDGVDGLDAAQWVAVAPDGAHVYATGRNDNAVAVFSREPFSEPPAADTDPPETAIVKGPKRKTKKRKAKFEFASDEPGSTFQCKLDKKNFTPCDQSEKFKVKRRKHKLLVAAVDPAGNTDPTPAKRKWKVKKRK